ncbi:MAG TPA: class I SAM-dependent methyltransferase [Ktedonobacteraceae bacterium]|jgi:ubiquinone/menaquinone biosynthesis C-methylase UbiE
MTHPLSWADKYEQELIPAIFDPWSHSTIATAEPQKGEYVLDVACGTGVVARNIASYLGPQGKVVGLDSNPEMLATARSLPSPSGATIQWIEGFAQRLPFARATFDITLCQGGLQFISDQHAALQEMYRVLKPGGRIVLMIFREIQYAPAFAILAETIASYAAPLMIQSIMTPFTLGDADAVQALVEKVGFQQISIHQETREMHFPSAEKFVRARLQGTYHHDTVDDQMLARAIKEGGAALRPYEVNGELVFPMAGYLLLAYKE